MGIRDSLNRDVAAMGFSTALSGFIGGLPVIAVIARSSVNINHGAKTRLSNLIHGVLILLFVFLLSDYIKMVPKAALMAILVFTGYKLSSPKVFKDASLKGYEQFLILSVTLLATLLTDLNKGILIGILFTVVIHLVRSHLPATLFFKYLAKPYFNLAKIDDHYHLRVKGVANFSSILKLRGVLETVPPKERVVFDFSRARLVDFSMLEFVNNWGKDYKTDHNGNFEIVGLDEHLTTSEHPYTIHTLTQSVAKPLSKRQSELKEYAFASGWSFDHKINWNTDYLTYNTFFETRPIEYLKNKITGTFSCGSEWAVLDITFDEGSLMAAEVHNMTMMLIRLNEDITAFELDKERLFSRLLNFAIKEDIDVNEDFDMQFSVKGTNKHRIKKLFTPELQVFLREGRPYHIESKNNVVLIFRYFRVMGIDELHELVTYGEELTVQFHSCTDMPTVLP